MTAGAKLAIGIAIVATVTAYMAYVGAATSWQYYLTVDECVASAAELMGQRVRVSGKVAPGSLEITADRKHGHFSLTGTRKELHVVCSGTFPDNLADGLEVVVGGRLEHTGVLRGDTVLARCASKYESPKPPASAEGDSVSAGKEAP
jgi:cytochrome c-type biogenesis protein CcmE